MNLIYLRGIIRNIRYSHTIDQTVFNKADIIVTRPDGREDLIVLKFKEFSMNYKPDTEVELIGNIRSFSQHVGDKNKVDIYVFSYFDPVEDCYDDTNVAILDGKICKKDSLRKTASGKHYIHYIVANNIVTEDGQKLNSYIPCVAWGKTAKDIENNYAVGDAVSIKGRLQSREYKKRLSENEIEIRMAHELATNEITKDEI
jgi:primosomal replication protein N